MSRTIGNVVALAAVLLVGATLADAGLAWWSYSPFLLCSLVDWFAVPFGPTPMLILFVLGLGLWLVRGFKPLPGVPIMAAAFIFGLVPALLAEIAPAACAEPVKPWNTTPGEKI